MEGKHIVVLIVYRRPRRQERDGERGWMWRRAYVFPRRRRGTRVIAAVACVAFGVDRIGLADACGLLVFVSFCLSLFSHSLGT